MAYFNAVGVVKHHLDQELNKRGIPADRVRTHTRTDARFAHPTGIMIHLNEFEKLGENNFPEELMRKIREANVEVEEHPEY